MHIAHKQKQKPHNGKQPTKHAGISIRIMKGTPAIDAIDDRGCMLNNLIFIYSDIFIDDLKRAKLAQPKTISSSMKLGKNDHVLFRINI